LLDEVERGADDAGGHGPQDESDRADEFRTEVRGSDDREQGQEGQELFQGRLQLEVLAVRVLVVVVLHWK
jgi:hypothetical protein